MTDLNLTQSTALVLVSQNEQVRIYTDLDDMRLMLIFKKALDFLSLMPQTVTLDPPEVGVITIIFDVNGKVFLNTNLPLKLTRVLVARFLRDILDRSAIKTEKVSSLPAIKRAAKAPKHS